MRKRTGQPEQENQCNPKATAVKRILNIAQLVRQRGTPEEADEALEWEKMLSKRLGEIEQQPAQQAA